jgi:Ca2+/Na+ antiporter
MTLEEELDNELAKEDRWYRRQRWFLLSMIVLATLVALEEVVYALVSHHWWYVAIAVWMVVMAEWNRRNLKSSRRTWQRSRESIIGLAKTRIAFRDSLLSCQVPPEIAERADRLMYDGRYAEASALVTEHLDGNPHG